MATYEILGQPTDEQDQRTISIEEEVTELRERRITLAQRKQEANQRKAKIKTLIAQHDLIIDEFDAIETELSITIADKPKRVSNFTDTELRDEFLSPPEWSSFQSHEFQQMPLGRKVTDEGNVYELIDQGQGYRKPSGEFGHFGWTQIS